MAKKEEPVSSSDSEGEVETKKVKKTAKKSKKDEPKKKTTKRKKDENAPRRYLTAFIYFSKEYRPTVKNENPEAKFGQIGSLIATKWNSMSGDEKKRFEELSKEDKKRWERECKEYEAKKQQVKKAAPASDNETDSSDSESDSSE